MMNRQMTKRLTATAALALGMAGLGVATAGEASAAQACESWTTLKRYDTGAGVTELQKRLAGWVEYDDIMLVDGSYGPQTQKAVARFQKAYGITVTAQESGQAGTATIAKLRSLTDSDCTPINFTYAEVSKNCGKGFTGSASVKENLRRSMWQAQALRRQLGDKPLNVTSGFRDSACNSASGGSSDSQHLTGRALDLVPTSGLTYCNIARQARYAGYGGIKGPGYPGHSNHVHVDYWDANTWKAPECGI
ncbi:zinc D-Ala-D-Ala carboxypeptidase [Barrientosiimonas humi]|uniref:Zinc D-Ala-D-Ala carboxypeptidase n=2 Tax=Barrientosiimonas humi TaxID=999931 RepID=A0A542XCA6_9MICO|nr:zinc D-Ala-D-Ala carboxypeptidase [Barrientosiimonas humi]